MIIVVQVQQEPLRISRTNMKGLLDLLNRVNYIKSYLAEDDGLYYIEFSSPISSFDHVSSVTMEGAIAEAIVKVTDK
jgi:hypothetical protein